MNSKPLASAPCRLLLLALVAAGSLMLAVAPRALAAPCEDTFSAAVGNDWNTKANWSKGEMPSTEENVCLETGPVATIAAGQSAGAMTVEGPVPVQIAAGGTLTITTSAALQGANVVDGEILGTGATVTLKSGSLAGTGTIQSHFINEGGTVEPGGNGTVGTLRFGSRYAQDEGGTLDLDLASDSSFDRLQPPVAQNALMVGHIDVSLLDSYVPAVGTTWDFISGIGGASWSGTVTPGQFSVHSFPGGAELRLDSALPSGGGGGETPGGAPGGDAPAGSPPSGGAPEGEAPTGSPVSGGTTGQGGPGDATTPVSPPAPETGTAGRCSATLIIHAATLKGAHVIVTGVAPRTSAGRWVRILLGAKAVAKAKVRPNGAFRATAPAPKARHRASALYVAVLGPLRSCGTRPRAGAQAAANTSARPSRPLHSSLP